MGKGTSFDIEQFKKRYSGLKKAPIEVWIAEFLKRNEQFQTDCLGVKAFKAAKKTVGKKALPEPLFPSEVFWHAFLQQKYGVALQNWEPENRKKGLQLTVSLLPPVRGIRILSSISNKAPSTLGEAETKAQMYGCLDKKSFLDFRDQRLEIIGREGWKRLLVTHSGLRLERDPCHSAIDDLLGQAPDNSGLYPVRDTLLLAIDLRRKREEINQTIDEFLKIHLLPRGKRRVRKEWLHYLMVYDLTEQHGMTPEKIADVLAHSYPAGSNDERNLSSVKNIKNYFQNAKNLIDGEYQEHLS